MNRLREQLADYLRLRGGGSTLTTSSPRSTSSRRLQTRSRPLRTVTPDRALHSQELLHPLVGQLGDLVHPGQPGHQQEMHPGRLKPGAPPPQPTPHRARRCTQPDRDPAVAKAGSSRRQRGTDHLDSVRPPQQHRDRQQHMRDQTPHAPGPPRPEQAHPTHATWPGPTPRSEHTFAACLPGPTAGGPLSYSDARHTDGADHGDQLRPGRTTPTSAASMRVPTTVVVIHGDVQQIAGSGVGRVLPLFRRTRPGKVRSGSVQ